MQISRELVIGYTTQIYTAILAIAFIPLYLNHFGAEAYGLIGFSLMLQGIVQLLDMGLGQTLMRETSRSCVDVNLKSSTYGLLLAGEKLFLFLSVFLVCLFLIALPWIASHWLKTENLPKSVIYDSVVFAVLLALTRLCINFYRSGLLGYNLQEWTNVLGAFFASLRYFGSVPLLIFSNFDVMGLLAFQLLISILELITYRHRIHYLSKPYSNSIPDAMTLLHQHYRMLGLLVIVSWLWMAITQLDKVLLSHWLSLGDYGLFSLAISAAGVITLIALPIGQLLQPRFNRLAASHDRFALLALYCSTTRRLTFLFFSIGCFLAFFAEPILFLWTHDALHAQQAAPILFWYALGNVSVALLTLPFMLQYALGNLRLHVIGNLLFAALWIPALVWAGYTMGSIGTGKVWFFGNTLFLLIWTSYTHLRLFPELPKIWLLKNIVSISTPITATTYTFAWLLAPYFYLGK